MRVLTSSAATYFKSHGVSSVASVRIHTDKASDEGWTERVGFDCSFGIVITSKVLNNGTNNVNKNVNLTPFIVCLPLCKLVHKITKDYTKLRPNDGLQNVFLV
jgi:hypothetical protein